MEKWVGVFFFVGIAVLAFLTFRVGQEGFLFQKGKFYKSSFDNAGGLEVGDPVWVAGIKKGVVNAVTLDGGKAQVTFSIDVSVNDDAQASVRSAGFVGGSRRLEVEPGASGKTLAGGSDLGSATAIKSRPPSMAMDDMIAKAADAMSELEKAVKQNEANVKTTFENLRSITDKLDKGEGTLGKLLTDKETFDNLKKTLDKMGSASEDLQKAMKGIRSFTDDLEKGEGSLSKLTKSPELYDKAKSALDRVDEASKSLKKFSDDLAEGKGTLGRLTQSDDLYKKLDKALDDMSGAANKISDSKGSLGKMINDPAVFDGLKKATDNLVDFSEKLQKGEGTLGKLMKDDSLYTEAKGFFKESRRAVEDAREQAPVSSFASVFFGAVR